MNRERLISFGWAVLLSTCLALGGLGMMVSGLNLRVDLPVLAVLCLLASMGLCGLLSWRYGGWVAAVSAAAVWLLPQMRLQLKALGRTIAKFMSMAYGTATPQWLEGRRPQTLLPLLLVLGCMMMIPWIRCVLKGKSVAPAVAVALVPLLSCVTVTDTVPELVWVFVWMLSLVLLLMTQGVRRGNATMGNRATALLLVPSVLMLALIFWLIPEKKADQWELSGIVDSIVQKLPFVEKTENGLVLNFTHSDTQKRVKLNTLGWRERTDEPIMEVTADYSAAVYFRERSYDHYSGVAWTATAGRTEKLHPFDFQWSQREGNIQIETHSGEECYYLPCYTDQILTLTEGILPNPNEEQVYSFQTRGLLPNWHTNGQIGRSDVVDDVYLQLPEHILVEVRTYLEKAGLSETLMVAERAEFIRGLVENCADYDLDPEKLPSDRDDLAMWFLESAEGGYCVHFATTAAVLLRAAGIPARYVEGYYAAVVPGQTVTVMQRHGHAWAEYYVDGLGWVILEATPGDGLRDNQTPPAQTTEPTQPESETTEPTQPQTTEPEAESVTTEPTQKETDTTQPRETKPVPTNPGQSGPEATEPKEEPNTTGKTGAVWLWALLLSLVGTLLIVAVFLLQYVLRRRRLRRGLSTGDENTRALASYRELCRLAAFLKIPIPREVTDLAEKAKFSNHRLTEKELATLSAHMEIMQVALSSCSLWKRLTAKWLRALC